MNFCKAAWKKKKALFSKQILKASKTSMAGSPVQKKRKKTPTFKPFMVETNKHTKHPRGWEFVQFDLCEFLSKNPYCNKDLEESLAHSYLLNTKKLPVPLVTIAKILLHS